MKHITFTDKSFMVGDEEADAVIKYAALLAQHHTADTVKLNAISSDGDEVEAHLLLVTGAPLMAETTNSRFPSPDNSVALSYMRAQTERFLEEPMTVPTTSEADATDRAGYEDF